MKEIDRFNDLNKQGFMKFKPVKKKKERKIVACDKCRDWHWEGQHTKK